MRKTQMDMEDFPQNAGGGRRHRRSFFVHALGFTALAVSPLFAITPAPAQLDIRANADEISVTAPRFHFLTGKALGRLRDGVSVPFAAQLSLLSSSQASPIQRAVDRFVVSYDLWEEKFAVTRLREPRMSVSHLTAEAAEQWCIERMHLPMIGIRPAGDLRIRLELRSEETKDTNPLLADSGVNLAGLIDLFSRPPRREQEKWIVESAPFRLPDFRKS